MKRPTEIAVELASIHELPMAYKAAIEKYDSILDEGSDNIWQGEIRFSHIAFEKNFRRTTLVAVFHVISEYSPEVENV